MTQAHLLQLDGLTSYREALRLQRAIAEDVKAGNRPDTVLVLEHEPVVTLGRRTDEATELHLPGGVEVEVVETDRGGRSTYHGPGQLVCYPILDLNRHGRDLKRYVRDLERAIVKTIAAFDLDAVTYEGLTGVWMPPAGGLGPRKIASIGVHASRWVTTHGYALNVEVDPTPFTQWITACGLEDAQFTSMAIELGSRLTVADARPAAAVSVAEAFGLDLEETRVEDIPDTAPPSRNDSDPVAAR